MRVGGRERGNMNSMAWEVMGDKRHQTFIISPVSIGSYLRKVCHARRYGVGIGGVNGLAEFNVDCTTLRPTP